MNPRELVCADLALALDELRDQGFRLDCIYPADDPHTAVLTRDGDAVRVTADPAAPAPGGPLAPFEPRFLLTRSSSGGSGEGRAGMLYRDLIPGRLGGRYIASHITVPGGGPVSDWVHYHRIAFQMIFVRRGWVSVVYQDQGDPFVMQAGDLVLQPPEIRHRVLESGDDLEVVEIGAPALHATFADHELVLPNGSDRDRRFDGQSFLRHQAARTPWTPFAGGEAQETAMAEATRGLAAVQTLRGSDLAFDPHSGELVFGFVLDGSARLEFDGQHELAAADAFTIPPGKPWRLTHGSPDFRLLHATTSVLD